MTDEDDMTSEGGPVAPEKADPAPAPAPASGDTKVLRVERPFWHSHFRFSDTIVVNRQGAEVPAEDADAIIEAGLRHGITITEVSK